MDFSARYIQALILVTLFCGVSSAQIITAKTSDGRAVLLKSDGTWTFALSPPKDAPATIYVYRLKEPGLYNRGTPIRLDGKEILEIKQGDFVGIELPPVITNSALIKMIRRSPLRLLPVEDFMFI